MSSLEDLSTWLDWHGYPDAAHGIKSANLGAWDAGQSLARCLEACPFLDLAEKEVAK